MDKPANKMKREELIKWYHTNNYINGISKEKAIKLLGMMDVNGPVDKLSRK